MHAYLNDLVQWAHHYAVWHSSTEGWVELAEVVGSIAAAALSLIMSIIEFGRGHLGMGLLFLVLIPVAFILGPIVIVGVIIIVTIWLIVTALSY
jgi:hypothetical protein